MKILQKIKDLFKSKEYRIGGVHLSFWNKRSGKVFTQYIYGIKIYKNRDRMLDYLNKTVLTTVSKDMKLLDYSEENK